MGKDITKIDDEVFLKYRDQVEVLFGGFPCQSFSQAGKKDPNDPRSQLFIHLIRAAKLIRPKYIIGENVKGLLSRKNNEGEKMVDIILEEFKNAGYNIEKPIVLNSLNFGVPQKRERLFFIAGRDSCPSIDIPTLPINIPKVRDILEDSLDKSIKITDDKILKLIPDNKYFEISDNYEKPEKTSAPPANLTKCVNFQDKSGLSFGKRQSENYSCIVDIDQPSHTIICTYSRMPRLFVPIKWRGKCYLRPYTVKELQQLQGFPRDFEFKGEEKDQIAQIGNAVPPPVVTNIIEQLYNI